MGSDRRGEVLSYKMIVTVGARSKSQRRITLITVLEVREEEPRWGGLYREPLLKMFE